ncbi:hypothetical protein AB0H36_47835 [Kribbella sp. NPDC050820]|uniref:hypothetical protein n=1 Tax=Kribbella sp. NPDC050820 TaxID=3155408 RepID=UPI0033F592B6
MPSAKPAVPPRPLEVGDIVIAPNDLLGEWAAAQITDFDPSWEKVGVLELDWSGPEPGSVDVLQGTRPLTLTHHAWSGRLSHHNCDWVLPRGYRVIGNLPLLHHGRSNSYTSLWHLGDQLFYQRAWDRGVRDWSDPAAIELSGRELADSLAAGAGRRNDIRRLDATGIESVDADRLVDVYPNLTSLTLGGNLRQLVNAASLNRLGSLRELFISNLFGMSSADCLLPERVRALEFLGLHSIPREYAVAMRSRWRSEIAHGTSLEIAGARKPEWVQENLNNPLRDWDGREHISSARFKKAVAQFKQTRRAILALLSEPDAATRLTHLTQLGRDYGAAFNRLDARSPFIETEEREELYAALEAVLDESEQATGRALSAERTALLAGVDDERDW